MKGVLVLTVCLFGCTPQKKLEAPTTPSETSEAKRDRIRIADLEKELARAKAAARMAKNELPAEQSYEGTGVVEVESPQTIVASQDDGKFMGIDADGTAVYYIGDAADEQSTPLRLSNDTMPSPKPTRRKKAATTTRLPAVMPKLGPVPTISSQLAVANVPKISTTTPIVGATVKEEYSKYLAALRAKNYNFAVAGFSRIVVHHSKSPYADNAQYWLAEAYYDQKLFKKSLSEFREVYENFPSGNKAADAMLKASYCYLSLGDRKRARSLLSQLLQVYPKSPIAPKAAEKLRTLE